VSGVRVSYSPLEIYSPYIKVIERKSLLYPYEVYHTYAIIPSSPQGAGANC